MSDDFSITDNIVLQNAVLDTSFRRLSMQHAMRQNQKTTCRPERQIVMTLDYHRLPLTHSGYVSGTVYLQHDRNNLNCSLRRGRDVRDIKFSSYDEAEEFCDKLCKAHTHEPGVHTVITCPECFPEDYRGDEAKEMFRKCICNGVRSVNDIGLEQGYYMRREDTPFVMRRCFDTPMKARFFHIAGKSCELRHHTTLIGPYEDLSQAGRANDIPHKVNGVTHLPCPACYGEDGYEGIGLSRTIYLAIYAELKLESLSRQK